MGKKYLDTKKGSLESSILGVWEEAAETKEGYKKKPKKEEVKKYMGFRNSTDKLKFQQALAKSYKSMLQAVKEDYVVPKTHSESILDRIDRKLKEKKNG